MEFQRFSSPDTAALEADMVETRGKLERALQAGDAHAIVEHAADLGSMLTTARQEVAAVAQLLDGKESLGSPPRDQTWFGP